MFFYIHLKSKQKDSFFQSRASGIIEKVLNLRHSWIVITEHPGSENMLEGQVLLKNTIKRSEICSKLTIKTPERRYWRRSGVFIVNFEHILLSSRVSIVDFEQVNVSWVQT